MPKLTTTVLSLLNPGPPDHILDLGCGDGVLTADLVQRGASVIGVDSSGAMIDAARRAFGHLARCRFEVVDACHLEQGHHIIIPGSFDRVFSNAALHWILASASTRSSVFAEVHKMLKPDGTLVFEMGGHGNVGDVHTALRAALLHYGVEMSVINRACPWFFPSVDWVRHSLEHSGFEVLHLESEWRPTRLTAHEGGGLQGWVRLFGASFLNVLDDEQRRDEVVRWVCDVLDGVCRRHDGGDDDGSVWLSYVRLRAVARKISN